MRDGIVVQAYGKVTVKDGGLLELTGDLTGDGDTVVEFGSTLAAANIQ